MDWLDILAAMLIGAGLDQLGNAFWTWWKEGRRIDAEIAKSKLQMARPSPIRMTGTSTTGSLPDSAGVADPVTPAMVAPKPPRPRKPRKRT